MATRRPLRTEAAAASTAATVTATETTVIETAAAATAAEMIEVPIADETVAPVEEAEVGDTATRLVVVRPLAAMPGATRVGVGAAAVIPADTHVVTEIMMAITTVEAIAVEEEEVVVAVVDARDPARRTGITARLEKIGGTGTGIGMRGGIVGVMMIGVVGLGRVPRGIRRRRGMSAIGGRCLCSSWLRGCGLVS